MAYYIFDVTEIDGAEWESLCKSDDARERAEYVASSHGAACGVADYLWLKSNRSRYLVVIDEFDPSFHKISRFPSQRPPVIAADDARQEAIDMLALRISSAGETGAFSFGLTLVEGAQILDALRSTPDADELQTEIEKLRRRLARTEKELEYAVNGEPEDG